MIKSKEDLREYIKCDRIALSGSCKLTLIDILLDIARPSIRRYELKLRKTEYWYNCRRRSIIGKIICMIKTNNLKKYGYKLGYSIPINAIGPGLCLAHVGTIVINDNVRIGSNARIHVDVNIGNSAPLGEDHTDYNVPLIGDNVYIGPGAKIYGKITIGDNARIGANAVVNNNVPSGVTVGGIPAKIISEKGSKHGLEVYQNNAKEKTND